MIGIRIIIAYGLMIIGVFFAIVTVLGLLRFPDLYTRIHAGAVALTISVVFLTMGIALYIWQFLLSGKILLVGGFFLISNPMSTHAIARVSYRKKIALPDRYQKDEYSKYMRKEE